MSGKPVSFGDFTEFWAFIPAAFTGMRTACSKATALWNVHWAWQFTLDRDTLGRAALFRIRDRNRRDQGFGIWMLRIVEDLFTVSQLHHGFPFLVSTVCCGKLSQSEDHSFLLSNYIRNQNGLPKQKTKQRTYCSSILLVEEAEMSSGSPPHLFLPLFALDFLLPTAGRQQPVFATVHSNPALHPEERLHISV